MLPEERDSEVDDIPDWLKMTSMRVRTSYDKLFHNFRIYQ